ncbi:MAG: type I phosphomannose isomerase catalytic subunit [Bacteroidales bacterium]|jgi:mannose-6-phosphate isomerase|nr:type I phosphomannose isomerase catalytic subunit [Bacteroidales bacterium]
MTELYPLKFKPILKERVWGGKRLATAYGKKAPEGMKIGESWELSGVQGDISSVANGFLEGNSLEEIVEVYMGDLVGEKVFEKFGREFPLLIKLIDANEDLSIQVHPPDELARERHHAYGKTEMWYVLEADKDAKIYTGFREEMTKEAFRSSLDKGDIAEKMNIENPDPGDVFFLPAGRVHAIGRGVVLAEIQQTSDITYRIWDWNRNGLDGKPRELHTGLSVDAIDYKSYDSYKTRIEPELNGTVNLIDCDYFTCNLVELDRNMIKDYSLTDSFIVYICTSGEASIEWDEGTMDIKKGETLLIPAIMEKILVRPVSPVKILEVYIREIKNK